MSVVACTSTRSGGKRSLLLLQAFQLPTREKESFLLCKKKYI